MMMLLPVVMIAIDGLRADQLTTAASREWNVPVLRGLARDGAVAAGVRGVLPTLTLPDMATLVTGTWPDAHGVVNNIRCGADAEDDGGYYWYARDVKVETLWDAARRAGMRTANVGWTSTIGASIDRNTPEVFHGKIDADGRAAEATALIQSYGPQFLTVFFEDLDDAEHRTGLDTPEDRQALEHIDRVIGGLVTAARARWPNVTIVVVSDHGFAPATTDINLYRAFADAGLTGKARPCGAGGSAYVEVTDTTDASVGSRVDALLEHLEADSANGIDRVLHRSAIREQGGWAGAESMIVFRHGYVSGRDPAAPLRAVSRYRGMHGYARDDPAMYATFMVVGPDMPLKGNLGIIDMRDIAPTVAKVLGVELRSATGRSLF